MNTSRRGFLGMLIGGVAAAAAERTFPFRVFSFPNDIKIPLRPGIDYYKIQWPYQKGQELTIANLERDLNAQWENYQIRPDVVYFNGVPVRTQRELDAAMQRLDPIAQTVPGKPRSYWYNPSGQNIPWKPR